VTIEPITPAAWDSVRAIYLEGIATGHATFETDAPDWETWIGAAAGIAGRWPGHAVWSSAGRR
jgi:L-amino acid N-acyltransferase YncA